MQFEPNEDQSAFLSVLDQMATSPDAGWRASADWGRFDWAASFDDMLAQNGFYDCAGEESLGAAAAAAMVMRLNELPILVESAASSLLRAIHAPDLPRPVAVIDGRIDHPCRFLPVARSVIHIGDDAVRAALLGDGAVAAVPSLFAYPMGVLAASDLDWTPLAVDPGTMRDRWRVAVCAEIVGSLKGGLSAVLEHVRTRHQFGRPLGSFQAIQHRLAEAAVRIEAGWLLALKAAQTSEPLDAALALGYVEDAATQIVYDLHQFMGAMGLTLEHPLHRWTYRVKLLRSALGGAAENNRLAAERRWGSR